MEVMESVNWKYMLQYIKT